MPLGGGGASSRFFWPAGPENGCFPFNRFLLVTTSDKLTWTSVASCETSTILSASEASAKALLALRVRELQIKTLDCRTPTGLSLKRSFWRPFWMLFNKPNASSQVWQGTSESATALLLELDPEATRRWSRPFMSASTLTPPLMVWTEGVASEWETHVLSVFCFSSALAWAPSGFFKTECTEGVACDPRLLTTALVLLFFLFWITVCTEGVAWDLEYCGLCAKLLAAPCKHFGSGKTDSLSQASGTDPPSTASQLEQNS